MRKIIGVATAIILTLGIVSGCGKEETKTTNSEKKVLVKIGTDAAYAPFEFLDAGKIIGFDADLLKEVMKEAKLDYDLKHTGWDPMLAGLGNGQLDMGISSISITEDRKKQYDFTKPYYESRNMIMVKEGSSVKSAEDLKNLKRIGVQNGTTGVDVVEKLLGKNNEKISKYETNVLAVMALKTGEVDAVVCDNGVAQYYVANNPKDKIIAIDDQKNFESEFYGIAFAKGSKYKDQVDKALETVIDNGKYAEIYKKWFKVEPNLENLKK